MKESFYFSHDYNAQQDPKMMELLTECGLAGVGLYWILSEQLHQQEDGYITKKQFDSYLKFYSAFEHTGQQWLTSVEQVLFNCSLFVLENEKVFSKRILEHKKIRKELSKKRSFAGKKSTKARGFKTSVEQVLTSVQHYKGKESKGNKKEIIKKNKNFSPPSLEEVKNYCKERSNNINASQFIDFYATKGWMVGKNKMKDWKACIRTWETRSNKEKESTGRTQHFTKCWKPPE